MAIARVTAKAPEYNVKGDKANGLAGSKTGASVKNAVIQKPLAGAGANPFAEMINHALGAKDPQPSNVTIARQRAGVGTPAMPTAPGPGGSVPTVEPVLRGSTGPVEPVMPVRSGGQPPVVTPPPPPAAPVVTRVSPVTPAVPLPSPVQRVATPPSTPAVTRQGPLAPPPKPEVPQAPVTRQGPTAGLTPSNQPVPKPLVSGLPTAKTPTPILSHPDQPRGAVPPLPDKPATPATPTTRSLAPSAPAGTPISAPKALAGLPTAKTPPPASTPERKAVAPIPKVTPTPVEITATPGVTRTPREGGPELTWHEQKAQEWSKNPGYEWVTPEHVRQYDDWVQQRTRAGETAGVHFTEWAKMGKPTTFTAAPPVAPPVTPGKPQLSNVQKYRQRAGIDPATGKPYELPIAPQFRNKEEPQRPVTTTTAPPPVAPVVPPPTRPVDGPGPPQIRPIPPDLGGGGGLDDVVTTLQPGAGATPATPGGAPQGGRFEDAMTRALQDLQAKRNPMFQNQRDELQRRLMHVGGVTGLANSGGFGDTVGGELSDLMAKQDAQLGNEMADLTKSESELAMQKYIADLGSGTELSKARLSSSTQQYVAELDNAVRQEGIRTNADLEAKAQELQKYGIDKDELLKRYIAELESKDQRYLAESAINANALAAAASGAASAAMQQAEWQSREAEIASRERMTVLGLDIDRENNLMRHLLGIASLGGDWAKFIAGTSPENILGGGNPVPGNVAIGK